VILVDSAIGSKDLIPDLEKAGLDPRLAHIDGDLAWVGRGEQGRELSVGVEFKRLPELVDSLRSGRLCGEQLPKMRKSYEFSWLLIEGELSTSKSGLITNDRGRPLHGKMTIWEFYERIWILYLKGGMFPWATKDRRQSIQAIRALYRLWTSKDFDKHQSHLHIYQPPPPPGATQFQATIATLPAVGWATARRAEASFRNLRSAFAATATEWQQVVSAKNAQKIAEAINGSH
jgi:ERCC4-type nuclease